MSLQIDPPEGYLYGFPKEIPEDRLKDYKIWIVEQGYPKDKLDFYVSNKVFTCRFIGDISKLELLKLG